MHPLQEFSASTPASIRLPEERERAARVDLSSFDNSWHDSGRNRFVRTLWFFLGSPLIRTHLNPSSRLRAFVLRLFGANIGRRPVLRPGIRVKRPWRLSLGNHCWLGEDVWLDNVGQITLSDHVCISQGAYLCTGNHDWAAQDFQLLVQETTLLEGSWVGAFCRIGPGVTLHEGAVASFGSMVVHDIPAFEIHSGNPASFVRQRRIKAVPIKP